MQSDYGIIRTMDWETFCANCAAFAIRSKGFFITERAVKMCVWEYAKYQFENYYGVVLRDESKFSLKIDYFQAMYGEEEVKCAIDIAINKYDDPLDCAMKIGGILYNRQRMRKMLFKEEE